MKNFMVCYTYTFGCDIFECSTKEEAQQKAIETIKTDFPQFPIRGKNKKTGKEFLITKYEELIEDIFEYKEEEDDELEDIFED